MTIQDELTATADDVEKKEQMDTNNLLNIDLSNDSKVDAIANDEISDNSRSVCSDDDDDDDDDDTVDGASGIRETSEDANKVDFNVKTDVAVSKKKIGPQRQKKEIHICMKKSKKFEIRKLTRRITVLRNLKGTEEQKAKNTRKVEKLLLEIQAMKEFMMDELTERVVDIFKGTSEEIYMDIWASAQNKLDVEKMLQKLSNGQEEKKYEHIAFLRMVSSKDILSKLQMVSSGMNIKKPKSKKALRKQLRKYNQKMKKMRVKQASEGDTGSVEKHLDEEEQSQAQLEQQENILRLAANSSDDRISPKKDQKSKKNVKRKKSKQPVDSFFLQADGNPSDVEDMSSDEEFTAPATSVKESLPKRKNRMGQRQRKQLLEREHLKNAKAKSRYGDKSKSVRSTRRGERNARPNKEIDTKVEDEKLHPSWKAKQKLKTQQGISEFCGTKIVFE